MLYLSDFVTVVLLKIKRDLFINDYAQRQACSDILQKFVGRGLSNGLPNTLQCFRQHA